MKIFLSHRSSDKSTVRDLCKCFPDFMGTWLDEKSLEWGEMLCPALEKTIRSETDFLIIFLRPDTLASDWVRRELEWAFERERQLDRVFVLPILLERFDPDSLPGLKGRLFLELQSTQMSDIEHASRKIVNELFKLIVKILDRNTFSSISPAHERSYLQRLKSIAARLSDAITRYPSESRQHRFIQEHIEALAESFIVHSERLRDGEVVTDYDDVSLLTSFVKDLGREDSLLGLSDWDADERWWGSEDAKRFFEANKVAKENGAQIARIFVYGSIHPLTPERRKLLDDEIERHLQIGVEVFAVGVDRLPKDCLELRSQCVLSHGTSTDTTLHRAWLTYQVQHDARRIPLRNVFSLREGDIADNNRMLNQIKSRAERRYSQNCGGVCVIDDRRRDASGQTEGRRIYIHRDSFDDLARVGPRAANLIYSFLVAVPVVKLAFHDLRQEAVFTEGLSPEIAYRIEREISKRWYGDITNAFRRIGYVPGTQGEGTALPVIGPAESIVATCQDVGYYTFATSEEAARRMYADVDPIPEIKRRIRDNEPSVRDLTLIHGNSLTFLDSTEIAESNGPWTEGTSGKDANRLTKEELTSIKEGIAKDMKNELAEIVRAGMRGASGEQQVVGENFVKKCVERVRVAVLSLPKEV